MIRPGGNSDSTQAIEVDCILLLATSGFVGDHTDMSLWWVIYYRVHVMPFTCSMEVLAGALPTFGQGPLIEVCAF